MAFTGDDSDGIYGSNDADDRNGNDDSHGSDDANGVNCSDVNDNRWDWSAKIRAAKVMDDTISKDEDPVCKDDDLFCKDDDPVCKFDDTVLSFHESHH